MFNFRAQTKTELRLEQELSGSGRNEIRNCKFYFFLFFLKKKSTCIFSSLGYLLAVKTVDVFLAFL